MSAFLVSEAHINALLKGAINPGKVENGTFSWLLPASNQVEWVTLRLENVNQVGTMLWQQNHMSVNYRYSGGAPVDPEFTFDMSTRLRTPLELLKLVNCYDYQSCDHPSWKSSESRAFTEALRRKLIQELPGYAEAPWDI